MAERRMFAKTIIDSDAFLDMPLSAQALYFHLSMRADDDGFINNPKKIQRMVGASDDDAKLLILKKFIIPFESGVVVIKHWRMHNYIRKDTYKETAYKEEKASLKFDENNAYTQIKNDVSNEALQLRNGAVDEPLTQVRLGKDRLEIVKDSIDNKKPTRHKYGEYKNVLLTDEDIEKLKNEYPLDYEERIEKLSCYMASTGKSYKNHLATIRNWARKETPKQTIEKPTETDNFMAKLQSMYDKGV